MADAAPTEALRAPAEEQMEKGVEEACVPAEVRAGGGRQRRQLLGAGLALLATVAVGLHSGGVGDSWQGRFDPSDENLLGSAPARALQAGPIVTSQQVTVQGPPDVQLSMVAGRCSVAQGPLREAPTDPLNPVPSAGLWGADKAHVVCFPNLGGEGERVTADGLEEGALSTHFHFVVSAPGVAGAFGDFGFGRGVKVAMRPDIETPALWPLMAGVETLGVRLNPEHASRSFALRAVGLDGVVHETPVVVVKQREGRARIDVQMVNRSLGECMIDRSLEDVGVPQLRFVCRAREGEEGKLAPVVVLCATCLDGAGMSISVTETGRDAQPESALNEGPFQNPAPWTGFSAEIPHGKLGKVYKVTVRKWAGPIEHKEHPEEFPRGIPVLTDRRLASAAEQERSQTEFLIAVVLDGAPVPFGEVKLPREGLEKVADLVSELCWLGQYLVAAALGAAALGLPVPVAALSPVVSALALAVQFCAILGGSDYVPPHFRSLFEPLAWVVPHAPGAALAWSLEVLAAVLAAHAVAVVGFLLLNGKGSAQALPHGLLFGAWELRALGFVALPLAYASSTLVYEGLVNADGSVPEAAWDLLRGVPALVGLPIVAGYAARRISRWFADEDVVKVEVPVAGTDRWVFIDRICDQLLAMPVAPGGCSLLSDWPASLGWRFAPTVALVEELEYRGAPDRRSERHGSWETIWYQGPWVQRRKLQGAGAGRAPAAPATPQEQASAAIRLHKVEASTRFAYACHWGRQVCVAGLVGLPWMDAAIPAASLRGMVRKTRGSVELRAQAGQLSGPMTGGRLAACFDWSDRSPYRVPADLLLKTILGAYIALLPEESDPSSSLGLAHPFLALACLALACMCFRKGGPHTHLMYNLALAAALLAVSLVIGSVWLCATHKVSIDAILLVMCLALALILLPVCLTLWAAAMMLAFGARILCGARGGDQMHDEVLPKVALRWAQPAPKAPEVRNKYIGVWWNDDCDNPDVPMPDSWEAQPTSAEAVVLEVQQYLSNQSRKPLPSVELPMVLHSVGVEHWQLRVPYAPAAGPKAMPVGESDTVRPRIPLPVGLITDASDPEGHDIRKAIPLAALTTEDGGILLYEDQKHNGGVSWQDAVKRQLKDMPDKELEKEVIRKIEEFQPKSNQRCAPCLNGSQEGDEPLRTIMALEISGRSI
mmetsp:Transcript_63361/g.137157  ORF Transcript_63361/g.137157 Transcript_63361/m.137157 type:complete len:1170 (-) Transcript_63361:50-3559(-)